ncbi:FAD-dependent oxidoreductase [Candidatus Solirubrobacter pratensis]|uniref:FAD-dependent oxidoreductase n=1 Tax=Candidatus Solirubrobacter pratensis TaxID=1298857 RepID=UPI000401E253|nr:FAD-dependent oxidoreductase [Candidatus Solirubrobacter pratensis]
MERVVIVGAGTFGASLAWWCARDGDDVVLVDQFQPGDVRATSGGETRLIRCTHGADADYTRMARRARTLWRELEQESGADLMSECGVSWFAHREAGWEAESLRVLDELGIPVHRLSVEEAARLFPSFDGDDLEWVLHEPEAGVLRAQKAVQTLTAQARAQGARILNARATPDGDRVRAGGEILEGDRVVWSCGGWLAGLFPEHVTLRVTRQELFFFDGGPAWQAAPGWVDYDRAFYGTGDLDGLGVKIAWDQEGPPLDPDADLPGPSEHVERISREYAAQRFPALAEALLTGSKRCRYEISPDSHFIAAPHPEHDRVWLVGGGSGHGFKHGPAMAERITAAWRDGAPLPPRFALGARQYAASLRSAGSNVEPN